MIEQLHELVYRYRNGALSDHITLLEKTQQGLESGWNDQTNGKGWNYKLENSSAGTQLYDACLGVARQLFKKFDIASSNSTELWAYVTHGGRPVQGPVHNHLRTATINMVYYLKVPKEPFPMGRLLLFKEPDVIAVTPNESDLLIFPGSMPHMPISNVSQDFRVALNLEIRCVQPEEYVFSSIDFVGKWVDGTIKTTIKHEARFCNVGV